ncbi:LysR family transcriptional regulator [Treponema parvum]|uniref:LysR family transcriptional regulator n=1 Tax=Treponema parvum TaxID=138851 RepID=A0A975F2G8_9SPIR|nr:LysR family transcriptional regulator [Treponema parvum]QTQ13075.1 LysR family transcriptional regulator [Treponema parvum]
MHKRDYEQLNYLITLAEELNITRAAERLYISQPALTSYLNRLEASLGVRLLDRSKSPLRITPAGQQYITMMKDIEYQKDQLLESIRRLDQPAEETLRIAIGRNRGELMLPRILPGLYRRFPGIHLSVFEDRDEVMAEKVQHNAVDIAIIESFLYVGSLSYLMLAEESHCLVTGAQNPHLVGMDIQGNDPFHPLDVPSEFINNQTFFSPSTKNGLNFYTQQLFSQHRLAPKDIVFIANNNTAYQLALKGLGTTYQSVYYADVVKTDEKPVFLMPGGVPSILKIFIVFKESPMTDVKRWCIDHTMESIRSFYAEPRMYTSF